MHWFFYFTIGFIVGIITLLFTHRISKRRFLILQDDIQREKNQIQELYKQRQEIENKLEDLLDQRDGLEKENAQIIKRQKEDIALEIQNLVEEYQAIKDRTIDGFNQDLEKEASQHQENVRKFNTELSEIMQNGVKEYQDLILLKQEELESVSEKLEDLRQKVAVAVEERIRDEEKKNEATFYKMTLAPEALGDIKTLRSIVNLNNEEVINKVIWKLYYERPCSDLVGRVVGLSKITGIYKITNLENKKCYIGQSVDIGNRFKQHIKRGVGAEDASASNKLYPAMRECGPENFSFEIIEECPAEKLTEREKFWTDYFKAQEFGYSIRKG